MKAKLSKKFFHVLPWIFPVISLLGFSFLGGMMWCGPLASQRLRVHEVTFCQTEDKTYQLLPTPLSPVLVRARQSTNHTEVTMPPAS